MGFLCEKISRVTIDPDEVLANINKFFQGMLIRTLGIDQIKEQVLSRISSKQAFDLEGWKNFIIQEIIQFRIWSDNKSCSCRSHARCPNQLQ